jgi:hypothetical protein
MKNIKTPATKPEQKLLSVHEIAHIDLYAPKTF